MLKVLIPRERKEIGRVYGEVHVRIGRDMCIRRAYGEILFVLYISYTTMDGKYSYVVSIENTINAHSTQLQKQQQQHLR